jgi:peptidoglycan/LPS O-acetylase OafA/YrhL
MGIPYKATPMQRNLALTISSSISLVLFTFHLTDDTLHAKAGMDHVGTAFTIGIMLTLLFGTVELADRRSGLVIMLLGGLATLYMPFLHTMGPRATRWGYFFIWTMVAMGASGSFSAVLAGRELWRSFRKTPVAT